MNFGDSYKLYEYFYFTLLFWIMISFIFILLFINLELNFLWRQRSFSPTCLVYASSLRRPFFRLLWWRCCWPYVLHVIRFHQIVGCEYVENRTVEHAKINLVSLAVNATLMKGLNLTINTTQTKRFTAKLNMSRYLLFILYRLKYASMNAYINRATV
jgi:hypothetical protein